MSKILKIKPTQIKQLNEDTKWKTLECMIYITCHVVRVWSRFFCIGSAKNFIASSRSIQFDSDHFHSIELNLMQTVA